MILTATSNTASTSTHWHFAFSTMRICRA